MFTKKNLYSKKKKTKKNQLIKAGINKKGITKFIILISILILYFIFLSYKYGFRSGGLVSVLTWSFFVFCTPVADAGLLLDFPLRLFFQVRMVFSEILVWIIALGINVVSISFFREAYNKTLLTSLLRKIILNPNPYWIIILLSGIGTFASIIFGDEMIDIVRHQKGTAIRKNYLKIRMMVMAAIFILVFFAYKHLISNLGLTY